MSPSRTPLPRDAAARKQDALEEVAETARQLRALETRQRQAVLRALDDHSWSEIGAALGVSKQAAHRKFVKDLAAELKTQVAGIKTAARTGSADDVAAQARALTATAGLMRTRRRD